MRAGMTEKCAGMTTSIVIVGLDPTIQFFSGLLEFTPLNNGVKRGNDKKISVGMTAKNAGMTKK